MLVAMARCVRGMAAQRNRSEHNGGLRRAVSRHKVRDDPKAAFRSGASWRRCSRRRRPCSKPHVCVGIPQH